MSIPCMLTVGIDMGTSPNLEGKMLSEKAIAAIEKQYAALVLSDTMDLVPNAVRDAVIFDNSIDAKRAVLVEVRKLRQDKPAAVKEDDLTYVPRKGEMISKWIIDERAVILHFDVYYGKRTMGGVSVRVKREGVYTRLWFVYRNPKDQFKRISGDMFNARPAREFAIDLLQLTPRCQLPILITNGILSDPARPRWLRRMAGLYRLAPRTRFTQNVILDLFPPDAATAHIVSMLAACYRFADNNGAEE